MPITRCPSCGARQLIENKLVGCLIACVHCEKSFIAAVRTSWNAAGNWLMPLGGVVVGALVSWFLIRAH
jgi:hypothetical protein